MVTPADKIVEAPSNDPLTIECEAVGVPKPKIIWLWSGHLIEDGKVRVPFLLVILLRVRRRQISGRVQSVRRHTDGCPGSLQEQADISKHHKNRSRDLSGETSMDFHVSYFTETMISGREHGRIRRKENRGEDSWARQCTVEH